MTDLELAKEKLRADACAFVIAKNSALLATGTRDGIAELLATMDALGDSARGAALADKIVGKAVALTARAAGIHSVYATLASDAAKRALEIENISFEYAQIVPLIRNKRNDGPCPMERLTAPIDDPRDAVIALRAFISNRVPA